MTRYFAAAVAAVCVAGFAAAQAPVGPIQGVPGPGCENCGSGGPTAAQLESIPAAMRCQECNPRFGVAPIFKKLLFWQKGGCTSCRGCGGTGIKGCAGGNCAGQPLGGRGQAGPVANPYPNGVPGTLVYPYNPYIRSPRDWFMTEK